MANTEDPDQMASKEATWSRAKEKRLYASSDRFIWKFLLKNRSEKIFTVANFLVNPCMHLVKTDKYLVKCQADYIIQIISRVGAMWSKVWQKTRLRDLVRFRSLLRDYG